MARFGRSRGGIDARLAMADLKRVQRSELPWVLAKSLTEVAKVSQLAVRARTTQAFKLHSQYIPRGVLVKYAQKNDFKRYGFIESAVFTSDSITPFMAWHETGGRKKPHGSHLTVPQQVKQYKFKTKSGAVRRKWKPRTLLSVPSPERKAGRRTRRLTKRPFIIPGRGTEPPLLVRRVGHGKRGLEVLYVFTPDAKIDPTWKFEETVRGTVRRTYRIIFEHELNSVSRNVR